MAIPYKSKDILNPKSLYNIYLLILPCMSYCVELWESAFKMAVNSITRATHQINKAGHYAHTNPLLMKSRVLKCNDLFCFNVMQLMYRAKTKSLPGSVQRFYLVHECKYGLIIVCKFIVPKAKKGIKRRCISVVGVNFGKMPTLI